MKKNILIGLAIFLVSISLTGCSFSCGSNPQDGTVGISPKSVSSVDLTASDDLTVGDDATIGGDAVISGNLSVTGSILGDEKSTALAPASVYATTTLTAANSGTTYYLSGKGNTITLPALASATGTNFRFVIDGAYDTGNFIIASAEGDNIEGTLIVAGAVVDRDAEDFVNFIADGENLGDYVEIRSSGQHWFIGDSGGLTTSKITCTDPS